MNTAELAARMRAFGQTGARMIALVLMFGALAACNTHRSAAHRADVASVHRSIPRPEPVPDWRPHFEDVSTGAIRVDLTERTLTYWEPGGKAARVMTIAVPRDRSLQRTGRTRVVRRKEGPSWAPTPAMLERDPSLPAFVPPGPGNPLGEYALYLGWRYYAVHGTNDQRSIGRRATSGCFRLAEDDIEWLFGEVRIGTPVLVEGKVTGSWEAPR